MAVRSPVEEPSISPDTPMISVLPLNPAQGDFSSPSAHRSERRSYPLDSRSEDVPLGAQCRLYTLKIVDHERAKLLEMLAI